jgi:hypothetical protein
MRKVKERAGVDVERLGSHTYKRAGIRTREFRALPPKVQEQLTGANAMLQRELRDRLKPAVRDTRSPSTESDGLRTDLVRVGFGCVFDQ